MDTKSTAAAGGPPRCGNLRQASPGEQPRACGETAVARVLMPGREPMARCLECARILMRMAASRYIYARVEDLAGPPPAEARP